MKRFSCSDSLDALFYPPQDKKNPKDNFVYDQEFQAMLDEEESAEENCQSTEKKRRLSIEQVKALEKIFEVDNKLDPERKVRLAQELCLQPRQVAIWFQNRRARSKTKQLERDYNLLKANYEALKLNYDKLEQEKQALTAELKGLKGKILKHSDEATALVLGSENIVSGENNLSPTGFCSETELTNKNNEIYKNVNLSEIKGLVDFKEPLSDSDSNGFLNEESNLNNGLLLSPSLSSSRFGYSSLSLSSSMNHSQSSDSRAILMKAYQQQFADVEDRCFSAEESCNIFSVDQAPTLHWYFPNQRN